MNSILGVQCHKVKKLLLVDMTNQYVIVLCKKKNSWVFKVDKMG